MLTLNYEAIRQPSDVFTEMGYCTDTPIIQRKQLIQMKPHNHIWSGIAEHIAFEDECSAMIASVSFFENVQTYLNFRYEQHWLKITLLYEPSTCLLIIEHLRPYQGIPSYMDKYKFGLIDNMNRTSIQMRNTESKQIALYISEKCLKKHFCFIPDVSANNWLYLSNIIRGKEVQEISLTSPIAIVGKTLIDNISNEEYPIITERLNNLSQLSEQGINFLLGKGFVTWNTNEKAELKQVILAEKQLTSDFKKPPLILEELCKMTGLNRQKFQKIFKDYYGKTFYQHYQEARFNYAKDLIENKSYNISETAYMTGFKHISHFAKQFEKLTGIKPSNLKKEYIH
jgi:AraC-like DNA-binding protein